MTGEIDTGREYRCLGVLGIPHTKQMLEEFDPGDADVDYDVFIGPDLDHSLMSFYDLCSNYMFTS